MEKEFLNKLLEKTDFIVIDNKTGLKFKFKTHKEKEDFFNLWDKYQVIEEEVLREVFK